jgi:molybdopterin molybdotransferase
MPNGPVEPARQLAFDEALGRLLALCAVRRRPAEWVGLDNATGRIAAADVLAARDLPPFANAAMDGYALRGGELPTEGERHFALAGTVLAGQAGDTPCGPGTCVRIMTGAPLPAALDTVVIQENIVREDGAILVRAGERPGANVRPAGEDCRAGDCVLAAGEVLTPARIALLAAGGAIHVQVAQRPRVGLLVTGDELVEPGADAGAGQVFDSNRSGMGAMLRQLGIEPLPSARVRDDPDALRVALQQAAGSCEVIVTSGGVSAGDADFLPAVVAELGAIDFHKVRMKPGMPFLCGRVGDTLVFGLPGNPVSAMVVFVALVRPALLALQGAAPAPPVHARLGATVAKRHGRTEFLRVRLASQTDGTCVATPLKQQGSGMLRGLAEADALAVIPAPAADLAEGAAIALLPLPWSRWA